MKCLCNDGTCEACRRRFKIRAFRSMGLEAGGTLHFADGRPVVIAEIIPNRFKPFKEICMSGNRVSSDIPEGIRVEGDPVIYTADSFVEVGEAYMERIRRNYGE